MALSDPDYAEVMAALSESRQALAEVLKRLETMQQQLAQLEAGQVAAMNTLAAAVLAPAQRGEM